MTHGLGPHTWRQVAPGAATLLVPLGSTEQHGPHLPLDTDTRIAIAWASGVARRLPNAVVAPPLPYGSSGEHQGFAGTLSIGQAALELLLVELIRSASQSFERIVLLSGHAGNAVPVRIVVERMRFEGHHVVERFPAWNTAAIDVPIDAHAGRTETSLLLHIAPEVVRMIDARPGRTDPIASLLPALRSEGVAAVSTNGVLGDPTEATAEEGARLLADLVERTVRDLTADVG